MEGLKTETTTKGVTDVHKKNAKRLEDESDFAGVGNDGDGKKSNPVYGSPRETNPEPEYRDLLSGFYDGLRDLSVRIWANGRGMVTSRHDNSIDFPDGVPTLVIHKTGFPDFEIPIFMLVASAFMGVGVDRVKSIRLRDGDPANCSPANLEFVLA
jgi:hypothetical protein